MVSDKELIRVIARKLKQYEARHIVVDPVMVATSGARLISEDAIETLKQELFPLATVLTPNIPEAEVLSGQSIKTAEDMISAAKVISDSYHCAVLCKGGHELNDANDLLYYERYGHRWFRRKTYQQSQHPRHRLYPFLRHRLQPGKRLFDLPAAVERAKEYISGALAAMLDLGSGSGPMDHGFAIRQRFHKRKEV